MKNNKLGCSGVILFVVLFSLLQYFVKGFFQSGWAGYVGFALLLVGIWLVIRARRKSKAANIQNQLSLMAQQCDDLVAQMGQVSPSGLALKKDEVVVGVLSQVGLLEFVSSGSSYSGVNNGIGIRITNGITWNTSGSSGQLTKNPDVEQTVDYGSAIFTNQRVLFAGSKFTREWDFNKLVNVTASTNGASVHMNVTGESKVSGLTYVNAQQLTPGVMLGVAQAYAADGPIGAERVAKAFSGQFRSLLA